MDEKLIKVIKAHPCLYEKINGPQNTYYHRRQAWQIVSRIMNIPETECINKWRNIRDRYVKQLRENSEPEWHLSKHLSFLKGHIQDATSFEALTSRSQKLISAVREHECLYNDNSRSYKNTLAREATWLKISQQLNTPVVECKKKWKSLRDRFVRECKAMQLAGDVVDRAKWELYSELEFLEEFLQTKKRKLQLSADLEREIKILFGPEEEVITCDSDSSLQSFEERDPLSAQITIEDDPVPIYLSASPTCSESSATECTKNKSDLEAKLNTLIKKVDKVTDISLNGSAEAAGQHDAFYKMLESQLNILPSRKQDELKISLLNTAFNFVKNNDP